MKIAISPPRTKDLKNYTSWLSTYNIDYIVLSAKQLIPADCTALLLTGGEDIGSNEIRDIRETKWLQQALERNLIVLGICRGLQLINVYFGGTLVQDIETNLCLDENYLGSKHNSWKEFDESKTKFSEFHPVNSNLSVFRKSEFYVNSRHHQCINELGNGVLVDARHDGIIEAISSTLYSKLLAVQWHPEREDIRNSYAEQSIIQWLFQKHRIVQDTSKSDNDFVNENLTIDLTTDQFIQTAGLVCIISGNIETMLDIRTIQIRNKKVFVYAMKSKLDSIYSEHVTLQFANLTNQVQYRIVQYLQENKLMKQVLLN